MAYEMVISALPTLPCLIVVATSSALLRHQTSLSKTIRAKEPKAVWALLVGNLLALGLYVCSWTVVLLRSFATFNIVILAIVATQSKIKMNSNDLFEKLISNIIKPALEQLANANRLSSELIEYLMDQKDESKGCALIRLSEEPRIAVVVEDSSQNFVNSIKDCRQKSFTMTKPKEFLTNLVCREVILDRKGCKRKLL